MCSEDTPAQNTDSVHAQLVDKHPAPPLDRGSVPDPQPTVAVEMTEEEVIRAVYALFRPDQQEDEDLTESDRNTSWRWSAAESPDQNSVQHLPASSTTCCKATFIRK